ITTLFGNPLSESGSRSANTLSTVVRLAAAMVESSTNLSGVTPVNGGTAASAVSTRNPITLIPLGSVACTVTLSFTSTREEIVCDTVGGVMSFPGVCTVTVTGFVTFGRPAASTANPVTANVVNPAWTVSMSVSDVAGGCRAGG